jgi:hypothetical protein
MIIADRSNYGKEVDAAKKVDKKTFIRAVVYICQSQRRRDSQRQQMFAHDLPFVSEGKLCKILARAILLKT